VGLGASRVSISPENASFPIYFLRLNIFQSPLCDKVRELDAIANRKRNLMMTMQQIKSEITAIAKAKRDKEAQVAIASAAAGKKGKKATAGKKKGPRKPAEPSRFDKVKQVFGADPAVRERNYYCAKNVGIFVGKFALLFYPLCCACTPSFFATDGAILTSNCCLFSNLSYCNGSCSCILT
jgi:hypothetical protein